MYQENKFDAAPNRRRMLDETAAYIEALQKEANARRAAYFSPDISSPKAYAESVKAYRNDLIQMLGKPLNRYPTDVPVNAQRVLLGEDELGTIERLWVEVAPHLFSYGILFIPHGAGKHPYVSAFHGGIGRYNSLGIVPPLPVCRWRPPYRRRRRPQAPGR